MAPKLITVFRRMKQAANTTSLQEVSLPERERSAVDCGLVCVAVHGHCGIPDGTESEIVTDAERVQAPGVDGLCLLSYRYTRDAEAMIGQLLGRIEPPVVMAGSSDGFPRLEAV